MSRYTNMNIKDFDQLTSRQTHSNLDTFLLYQKNLRSIKNYMKKKFGNRRSEGVYFYPIYISYGKETRFLFGLSHDIKYNYDDSVDLFRKIFGGLRRDSKKGVKIIKTIFNVDIFIDIPRKRKKDEKCFYYGRQKYENTTDITEYFH